MILQTLIKDDAGNEKSIGYFDDKELVWNVCRTKTKHFHKKMSAWGLDNKVYEMLKSVYGLKKVHLRETLSEDKFECSVEAIDEHKKYYHFKPHRLQIFIHEKYWKII